MANDLNGDVLTFKYNLMLVKFYSLIEFYSFFIFGILNRFVLAIIKAQAQECVLEKSIIDQRKTSINAKISAQIIDYYKIALTNNEKVDFQNNVNSRQCKVNEFIAKTGYNLLPYLRMFIEL
jgi:hypothetical protein